MYRGLALVALLTLAILLGAACTETKIVPASPTVIVVAPSPTVIFTQPTATPSPTAAAALVVNSVVDGRGAVPRNRQVLVANIVIENTGLADVVYSESQFRAIDSDGFSYRPASQGEPSGGILLQPPLLDGTLKAGEKIKAQLAFNVATGTSVTQLRWSLTGLPDIVVEMS